MYERSGLIRVLKTSLKERRITYKALARRLELSEATIKRSFSRQDMTLARLEQICQASGLTFGELTGAIVSNGLRRRNVLSIEQERALASDARLLSYFYLLVAGLAPSQIVARFEFSELEGRKCLLKLDKLGLVDALPRDRVSLRVSRHVRWLPAGPLWKRYGSALKADFMSSDFQTADESMRFVCGEMSESAWSAFSRKMERLMDEFHRLSDLSVRAGQSTQKMGVLFAGRPWKFAPVSRMRRKNVK